MAIKNTKQLWELGQKVNIGFMKGFEVTGMRAEYDGLPDIYELQAPNGKRYEFIPHNGLHAI